MKGSIALARVAWLAAAFGCSSTTTGPVTGPATTGTFSGTWTGTYAGVYTITSPVAEPEAQNTESGTFVISTPTATTLNAAATFTGPGGVSGECSGTGTVSGNTATSNPAAQTCTYAVTGGSQTNVGSSAFTLSGNTITDVLNGTFTGTNANGNYAGTYSGTWTLTLQQ